MAAVNGYQNMTDPSPLDPPPEYSDIAGHQQIESKMYNLDEKIRKSLNELDGSRQELRKVKSLNKNIETKTAEVEKERDSVQQKIDSLKTKLGMSNTSLNKCNDEKEAMRTKLNDSQVLVARLEERLSAASSELDRMRDPANPDSNMCIKKQVVNNKKEMKRLKAEIENERNNLDEDNGISKSRDDAIKQLEKELANTKAMLKVCEEERTQMQYDETEEQRQKEELVVAYKMLKEDSKTYEKRLKDAKISLGVKKSGKNVNERSIVDLKKREKELAKQLSQYEKKLKEVTSDLETLKNQHKMTKTAQSINNYTKRALTVRGADPEKISLAQSGPGPVKFGSKPVKEQTGLTNRSKTSDQDTGRSKDSPKGSKTDRGSDKSSDVSPTRRKGTKEVPTGGSNTNRSTKSLPALSSRDKGSAVPKLERQATTSKLQNNKRTEKRNSVQFVPPPKAKLTGKS